jgi:hypothetical protein
MRKVANRVRYALVELQRAVDSFLNAIKIWLWPP